MPAPISSPRSTTFAGDRLEDVGSSRSRPAPDGQHGQLALPRRAGAVPITGPSTKRASRELASIHSTPTVLACHQTLFVGQRDAVHRPPRRVGPSESIVIDDVGALDRLGGGAGDGRAEPLRLRRASGSRRGPRGPRRQVARHRRAHDPGAEERRPLRTAAPRRCRPAATRSSWWRTTIAFADCSIAFSIAGSTMSSTGSPCVGVRRAAAARPAKSHAPGGLEVLARSAASRRAPG